MQVPVVGGRDFANQRRMVVVETTAARRPVLAGSALQIDAGRNGVCLVVRSAQQQMLVTRRLYCCLVGPSVHQ